MRTHIANLARLCETFVLYRDRAKAKRHNSPMPTAAGMPPASKSLAIDPYGAAAAGFAATRVNIVSVLAVIAIAKKRSIFIDFSC